MTRLVAADGFDLRAFAADPVAGVRDWLQGYFEDRGAAVPATNYLANITLTVPAKSPARTRIRYTPALTLRPRSSCPSQL